jgi:D-tyrosyl-tRNA(Tyr) deacylase
LEGKYAFAHMMPKHQCTELDMLGQAIERSAPKAEIAVIEWKGLKAEPRRAIIEKLSSLGLDYERV